MVEDVVLGTQMQSSLTDTRPQSSPGGHAQAIGRPFAVSREIIPTRTRAVSASKPVVVVAKSSSSATVLTRKKFTMQWQTTTLK